MAVNGDLLKDQCWQQNDQRSNENYLMLNMTPFNIRNIFMLDIALKGSTGYNLQTQLCTCKTNGMEKRTSATENRNDGIKTNFQWN